MHHDAHIHCLDVYNVFNDFVFVGINFVEFTLKKGLIWLWFSTVSTQFQISCKYHFPQSRYAQRENIYVRLLYHCHLINVFFSTEFVYDSLKIIQSTN